MKLVARARSYAVIGAMAFGSLGMVAASPDAQAAVAKTPPAPRMVEVQVVPALAGVPFTLDGSSYVTLPGGTATFQDPQLADVADRLTITPDEKITPDLRVSLDRVANDPNHPNFTRKLVVELDEDRMVSMQFLTPKRKPLPLSEISSVTLTDSLGGTLHYTGAQLATPQWLPVSRPAIISAGVNGRLVTYAFKSVVIRGANVVNSGQLRFTPNHSTNFDAPVPFSVPVILHSLTIEANDLLAGAPAGKSAQLTYPDKSVETVSLGAQHKVTLNNLPRGTYQLKVGGGLIALSSTVRLSRDQTATEVVITGSDVGELALMLFSVLAVVVAAGVIGRRLRRQADRKEGTSHALLA
jgi:hypothetical protein